MVYSITLFFHIKIAKHIERMTNKNAQKILLSPKLIENITLHFILQERVIHYFQNNPFILMEVSFWCLHLLLVSKPWNSLLTMADISPYTD